MVNSAKILFLCVSILSGFNCQNRTDVHYQKDDTGYVQQHDYKKDLAELDEPFEGFDYESALTKFKDHIPPNASITKFRNFLVISSLKHDTTYSVINKDLRCTYDAMLQNYINIKPDKVTPLFLFRDFESYRDFALNAIGSDESDLSPYGFYKISKNVIVIRFVSWKGSPTHEATHVMIQNDFPDIPSWFNEGMAALHEKATYTNGELIGDFSWRILSLRRAFNEDKYTGLAGLMNTNDDELYGKRSSFYYAQARYLLMMLQQQGLLKDYYKLFRDTYNDDKTGIKQLEKITGKNLAELDKELSDYIKSFTQ